MRTDLEPHGRALGPEYNRFLNIFRFNAYLRSHYLNRDKVKSFPPRVERRKNGDLHRLRLILDILYTYAYVDARAG